MWQILRAEHATSLDHDAHDYSTATFETPLIATTLPRSVAELSIMRAVQLEHQEPWYVCKCRCASLFSLGKAVAATDAMELFVWNA